jgi:hypothetical protein
MDTGIELHFCLSVSYELLQPLPGQRLLLRGKQFLIPNNTVKKLKTTRKIIVKLQMSIHRHTVIFVIKILVLNFFVLHKVTKTFYAKINIHVLVNMWRAFDMNENKLLAQNFCQQNQRKLQ